MLYATTQISHKDHPKLLCTELTAWNPGSSDSRAQALKHYTESTARGWSLSCEKFQKEEWWHGFGNFGELQAGLTVDSAWNIDRTGSEWAWCGGVRPHLGDLRYQAKERGLSQAGWGDTAALRDERHTDSVLWEMCPVSGSVICKVVRLVLHVNWVKRPVRCQSSGEENQWELFTWQLWDHQEDKGMRKTCREEERAG